MLLGWVFCNTQALTSIWLPRHTSYSSIQGIWLMLCSALVSIGLLSVIYQNYLVHLNMWFQLLYLGLGIYFTCAFTDAPMLSQVTENAHKVLLSDSIFLKLFCPIFWFMGSLYFQSRCHRGFVSHSYCTVVYVYFLFFLEKSYIFIEQPERKMADKVCVWF